MKKMIVALLFLIAQASVAATGGDLFVGLSSSLMMPSLMMPVNLEAFHDVLLDKASRFLPLGDMPPEVELPVVEEVAPLPQHSFLGELVSTVFVTVPAVVRFHVDATITSIQSTVRSCIDLLSLPTPPDASEPYEPFPHLLLRNNNTSDYEKEHQERKQQRKQQQPSVVNTTMNIWEPLCPSSPRSSTKKVEGDVPFALYWAGRHGFHGKDDSSSAGLLPYTYELFTKMKMTPFVMYLTGVQADIAASNSSSLHPIENREKKSVPFVMYLTGHPHGPMKWWSPSKATESESNHGKLPVFILTIIVNLALWSVALNLILVLFISAYACYTRTTMKEDSIIKAAVKIQAAARGHQQVVTYQSTRKNVIKIQGAARSYIQRVELASFQEFIRKEQEKEQARRANEKDATHDDKDDDRHDQEVQIDNTLTQEKFDRYCLMMGMTSLILNIRSMDAKVVKKIWKVLVIAESKGALKFDVSNTRQYLNEGKDAILDVIDERKTPIYFARWAAATHGVPRDVNRRILGVGMASVLDNEVLLQHYNYAKFVAKTIVCNSKDEQSEHVNKAMLSVVIAGKSYQILVGEAQRQSQMQATFAAMDAYHKSVAESDAKADAARAERAAAWDPKNAFNVNVDASETTRPGRRVYKARRPRR
jgi:IQ calmodulin-binding motif